MPSATLPLLKRVPRNLRCHLWRKKESLFIQRSLVTACLVLVLHLCVFRRRSIPIHGSDLRHRENRDRMASSVPMVNVEPDEDVFLDIADTRHGLPGNDNIRSSLEQDIKVACEGKVSCITIHVFAFDRPESTARLLETLESSNYDGYSQSIPLVVHVDGPQAPGNSKAHDIIVMLAREIPWTHGPKILNIKQQNMGLKASWLSAWTSPQPDDLMIAFEDDVVPSPLYFQWMLKLLKKYNML